MYLRYGSDTRSQHEATVVISVQPNRSARGFIQFTRQTWQITGVLQGDTQALVIAAISTLESAYGADGFNVYLLLDDQSTVAHQLLTANAMGGVQVVSGPSYPVGDGAELSTFRHYTLTLQADYQNTGVELLDFENKVIQTGNGGPSLVFLETLEGIPQQQIGRQRTTYKATQTGYALGRSLWPAPAPPQFPNALLNDSISVAYTTPKQVQNQATEYRTEWSYQFESAFALSGTPQGAQ